jgi:hypothetical protein
MLLPPVPLWLVKSPPYYSGSGTLWQSVEIQLYLQHESRNNAVKYAEVRRHVKSLKIDDVQTDLPL